MNLPRLFLNILAILPMCAADRLLVGSRSSNNVLAYDAGTGVFLGVFASGGGLAGPGGMAFGPDGALYVSSTDTNQILRFDGRTGAFLSTFVSGGPLQSPLSLAFGPDGNLYVASFTNSTIYSFDGRTGAGVSSFGASGPLNSPGGMAFDASGSLFISSTGTNRVLNFDVKNGNLIRSIGGVGGLTAPTGLTIASDGSIYVSSAGTNQVLHYGSDGAFLGPAASGPEVANPLGLAFGPAGDLFVGTILDEILRFGGGDGQLISHFVTAGSGGLKLPVAFLFSRDGPVTPSNVTVRTLSGDLQETFLNNLFIEPLVVEVKDGDRFLGGQAVRFSITSGGGFLIPSPTSEVTDALGRASTRVVAASFPGVMTVTASVGTAFAVFTLTSRIPPPPPPMIAPDGVTHAARRTAPSLKNSQPVRGGMIAIEGLGLGPTTPVEGIPPLATRLPDEDAGTIVRLYQAVDNSTIDAPVVSASDTKVVAIVPSSVQAGEVVVSVWFRGRQSNGVKTTVVDSNFGIFTRNEQGYGPAVGFTVDDSGEYRAIGLANPAFAGQTVAIRGSGLGPVGVADNAASAVPFDVSALDVLVGGVALPVTLAARSSVAPGTDEIQFQIPDNGSVPDGCYVPVVVRSGGVHLSNFGTISKAPAGSTDGCGHSLNLSLQKLAGLDRGEAITAGVLGITRLQIETPLGPGMFVGNGGLFANFDSNSLFVPGGLTTMTVTDGSCTVYQSPALPGFQSLVPIPVAHGLDAGPSLTLTPPNMKPQILRRRESSGGYDKSGLADAAEQAMPSQGTWTFEGKGGAGVQGFTASLELPTPIVWTNHEAATEVDRSKDLVITWQADSEAQSDKVVVSGGMFQNPGFYSAPLFIQFACLAPFSATSLTVPSYILQEIPASTTDDYFSFVAVMNSAFGPRSTTFSTGNGGGAAVWTRLRSRLSWGRRGSRRSDRLLLKERRRPVGGKGRITSSPAICRLHVSTCDLGCNSA